MSEPKIVLVKQHRSRYAEGYVLCNDDGKMSPYDVTLCLPMFAWEEIYKGFAEVKVVEPTDPSLIDPDSHFKCIVCGARFRVGDGHKCEGD